MHTTQSVDVGSDDDSDSDWGSDSESSSDDEDDDNDGVAPGLTGRARWLKTAVVVKEKVVKDKNERSEKRKAEKEMKMAAVGTKSKAIISEEEVRRMCSGALNDVYTSLT